MTAVPEEWSREKPSDHVKLLVNANSRRGQTSLSAAVSALAAGGVKAEAVLVKEPEQATALLQAEIARGATQVIVGGGDGTLSHAANLLRHTSTALGVLPLGTGNTFARSIGVPLHLDGAAEVICQGETAAVDVGLLNGRAFLNSVAMGVSAEIARDLTPEMKRQLGLLAWPVMGAKVLWRHRALHLDLSLSNGQSKIRTHQLLIVNGRYVAGPIRATPNASVADSQLDVLVLGGKPLFSLLSAGMRWIQGRPTLHFVTDQITVQSDQGAVWVSIDGDVVLLQRLEVSVQTGALLVRVPSGFNAQKV